MFNPAIALLAWPLVALWLFARLPFEKAIIWSVVASYLLLPSTFAIDLPGVPPMEKQSLPNLVLLLIVLAKAPRSFRLLPPSRIAKLLLLMLFAGSFLTAMTNQDPIWIAERVLPGLTLYDGLSSTVRSLLIIAPLLIGWQYLATPQSHREILKAFCAAGLAYSLLMLFEVRMSPQLHTWVYGYFPHSFAQQIRWGGYRPVVFLTHGLHVAFFAMTVTLAAAALWRENQGTSSPADRPLIPYGYATTYLAVVLVFCKSLGSLLYGVLFLPVVLFMKVKRQLAIAALLAAVALSYPILRGVQMVPTDTFLEWAEAFDPARRQSLYGRFYHEEMLLEHARERILFGWGSWGRNRIHDAETGEDISVTDGYWAIVIGSSGWVGYLATFGLLGFPILMLWLKARRQKAAGPPQATVCLALLLGINMIELLPNATLQPWTWLIAGAILGYAVQRQQTESTPEAKLGGTLRSRTVL